MKCPTCKQDMNDKPREGWHGMDCPQCGQGFRDARHVRAVLMRQSKASMDMQKEMDEWERAYHESLLAHMTDVDLMNEIREEVGPRRGPLESVVAAAKSELAKLRKLRKLRKPAGRVLFKGRARVKTDGVRIVLSCGYSAVSDAPWRRVEVREVKGG